MAAVVSVPSAHEIARSDRPDMERRSLLFSICLGPSSGMKPQPLSSVSWRISPWNTIEDHWVLRSFSRYLQRPAFPGSSEGMARECSAADM